MACGWRHFNLFIIVGRSVQTKMCKIDSARQDNPIPSTILRSSPCHHTARHDIHRHLPLPTFLVLTLRCSTFSPRHQGSQAPKRWRRWRRRGAGRLGWRKDWGWTVDVGEVGGALRGGALGVDARLSVVASAECGHNLMPTSSTSSRYALPPLPATANPKPQTHLPDVCQARTSQHDRSSVCTDARTQ